MLRRRSGQTVNETLLGGALSGDLRREQRRHAQTAQHADRQPRELLARLATSQTDPGKRLRPNRYGTHRSLLGSSRVCMASRRKFNRMMKTEESRITPWMIGKSLARIASYVRRPSPGQANT